MKHIFRAENYHYPSPLGKWIDIPLLTWKEERNYFFINDKLKKIHI